MPKISVIIPVYNAEQYLRKCLDSVVSQTFRDIEIICVDDGSTDSSPAILDEYSAKDNRVVAIHQANAGVAAARNTGLKSAQGDYLAFLDSDDAYNPQLCERAYNRACQSGADIVKFLYTRTDGVKETDDLIDNQSETETCSKLSLAYHSGANIWGKLWRREFVAQNEMTFPLGVDSTEDAGFCIVGAALANKITVLRQYLYEYNYRENSLTTAGSFRNAARLVKAVELAREKLAGHPDLPVVTRFGYGYVCRLLYDNYQKTTLENQRSYLTALENDSSPEFWTALSSGTVDAPVSVRYFFLARHGSWINRIKYRLKNVRNRFFDAVAKWVARHSPWMQQTLDSVESQKAEIERIRNLLNSNSADINGESQERENGEK
ncbi:MAG: glycosyltransferase family 2 protein [Thermoguttaceae bacterium]|nr:glycosyltransferase family 2 protein [Thermoguttaceae bacterium]